MHQRVAKKNHPRGATLVVVAVLMAAFLVFTAFVIDIAAAYVLRARLYNVADTAVDAGMATVSDLIIEFAEAREPNPEDGTDPLTVLTDEDRSAIISDTRVQTAVETYLESNLASYGQARTTLTSEEITFPANTLFNADCSVQNEQFVDLEVVIEMQHTYLLSGILTEETNIDLSATSIKTIRICPS
jgi:hypothetical protein